LHLRLARFDSYLGEIADAREHVAEARALLVLSQGSFTDAQLDDGDAYYYRPWQAPPAENEDLQHRWLANRARTEQKTLDTWDLVLDVRSGQPMTKKDDWRTEMLMAAGNAKHGDATALARLADRDARDSNQKLWHMALSNDDDALVGRLHDRNLDGRGVVDYLGASPRPELARWVRLDYPTACTSCGLYPLAHQIASRRDAAVAAHADDVATEMGAAARRIRDILNQRENAVTSP
jgi:hypothetical protein